MLGEENYVRYDVTTVTNQRRIPEVAGAITALLQFPSPLMTSDDVIRYTTSNRADESVAGDEYWTTIHQVT
jgi:hypothetical protein